MSVSGALITRVPFSTIKFPYPKTTYCDVPLEAQTSVPMCCPLPRRFFPITAPLLESPNIADAPSPSLQSPPPLAASPASILEITDHHTKQGACEYML